VARVDPGAAGLDPDEITALADAPRPGKHMTRGTGRKAARALRGGIAQVQGGRAAGGGRAARDGRGIRRLRRCYFL
jgi:hypothetical protein